MLEELTIPKTNTIAVSTGEDYNQAKTLVTILRQRALLQADRLAYSFLLDGEEQKCEVTYGELDRQARAIAAWLQMRGASGCRVLLLYPSGLEYLAAFLGCLYAGAIAVPIYPPRFNRTLQRLETVVVDARATFALTTEKILSKLASALEQLPKLQAMHWMATDGIASELSEQWCDPGIDGNSIAFLQYTSGSTSAPRGVMVSHRNILHNQKLIQLGLEHTECSIMVSWLPFYHDMGLLGTILQPLYVGFPSVLMSPMAFLQRPVRWLQAITRYRATTSGAPNFAYDLCVSKVTAEQRAELDLSSWDAAFNGSEQVHAETLERFTAAFAPCGFRHQAFYPCYGLAEATLVVSGGKKALPPQVETFQAEALKQGFVVDDSSTADQMKKLVSCGHPLGNQKVVIVDPDSLTACPPNRVGEVWVAGDSVTGGYFEQPEATIRTFDAHLADTGEGPFLRTGDLGFLRQGELFIVSRLKDLIIIRGQNYSPDDIEWTVEHSHPALRPHCGAAFTIEAEGEERLVIANEVGRDSDLNPTEISEAIRTAVSEEHGLRVETVLLLKSGTLPKTTSGKIQRRACREAFLAGELEYLTA